jgi:hypothetical protein
LSFGYGAAATSSSLFALILSRYGAARAFEPPRGLESPSTPMRSRLSMIHATVGFSKPEDEDEAQR